MIRMNTIILCTDFSENAKAASQYAAELARRFGATIHLVHAFDETLVYAGTAGDLGIVMDPGVWLEESKQQHLLQLNDQVRELEEAEGVNVKPVLLFGSPVREIVEYAARAKADCLVIATHGRTGLLHFLYGSVAEKIIRTSPCPVFTVHPVTTEKAKHEPEMAGAGAGRKESWQKDDIIL